MIPYWFPDQKMLCPSKSFNISIRTCMVKAAWFWVVVLATPVESGRSLAKDQIHTNVMCHSYGNARSLTHCATWELPKQVVLRVPVVAQWVKNLTGIHDDESSIPGFTQWVKGSGIAASCSRDHKMLLGSCIAVAAAIPRLWDFHLSWV